MKYYKNGGFYDKEVHALGLAGGDETKLEETWAAFIADAVEVSDEDWQGLINVRRRESALNRMKTVIRSLSRRRKRHSTNSRRRR